MRFKISWLEHHVCETDEKVKFWLDNLPPNTKNMGNVFGDEIVEFECLDTFKANDIEEAKKKASEYECGEENVFTVFNDRGNRLFTEEDL